MFLPGLIAASVAAPAGARESDRSLRGSDMHLCLDLEEGDPVSDLCHSDPLLGDLDAFDPLEAEHQLDQVDRRLG